MPKEEKSIFNIASLRFVCDENPMTDPGHKITYLTGTNIS